MKNDLRAIRFNEAGAINPGKRRAGSYASIKLGASMRPGQLTPENLFAGGHEANSRVGFNEAGAINPGKLIDQFLHKLIDLRASMRPGQLTPENTVDSDIQNLKVPLLQ